MNKRFYILMFLTLSLTIVILSASYAKDSGVSTFDSVKVGNNNLVVNYANDMYAKVVSVTNIDNYKSVEGYRFNVLNKNDTSIKYDIEAVCDDCIDKVYYSINNSKPELLKNNIIYSSTLEEFGKNGDLEDFNIKFMILDKKYDNKIKINIIENNNSLESAILKNKDIKLIDKDYIFNGENNYIKYNNNSYRIIGILDHKVMLFDVGKYKSTYKDNNNYLDQETLFKIYDVKDIDEIADKKSWLDSFGDFWLKDNKEFVNKKIENAVGISYESNVTSIDGGLELLSGSGSMEEPYEVNYES